MSLKEPRPSLHEYNMALAVEVATRSNCMKNRVGAIIVNSGRVRAVGYNGTVEGYADCFKGGCPRCNDLDIHGGEQLDRCICVHAEENALISAARFGISVEGADCYVTHEPCVGCTKLLIQSHIARVIYLTTYEYSPGTDHNATRDSMRKNSMANNKTKFIDFKDVAGTEADKARRDDWIKRLIEIKAQGLAYATELGVVKKKA